MPHAPPPRFAADFAVSSPKMHAIRWRDCKGPLINLDSESGKGMYGAMKERALDGLSIDYKVGEFTRSTKPNEPRRTIKIIKSLPEVSLVTFPMNELARTGAVNAADIRTVREFEDALRDVLGFSHAAAKSIAQRGFKAADTASSRLDNFIASLRDVREQIYCLLKVRVRFVSGSVAKLFCWERTNFLTAGEAFDVSGLAGPRQLRPIHSTVLPFVLRRCLQPRLRVSSLSREFC
jgi:hypothetical protein